MKNSNLILILVSLFSLNSFAWRESFGGNASAAEFKAIGYGMVDKFSRISEPMAELSAKLYVVLEAANLECKPVLSLEGQPKDAVNYPYTTPQKIELDCVHWTSLSQFNKYQIVAHELLSLAYIDDTNYYLSGRMAELYDELRTTKLLK